MMGLFIGNMLFSQVSVNTTGTAPDPTAILDVSSDSLGILVPRMTMARIEAINAPAKGLLTYCTDDNNFFVNRGTSSVPDWTMVNSKWKASGQDIFFLGNKVGIGWQYPIVKLDVRGNSPDDAAALQLCNSDLSHKLLLSGGRLNDPSPVIQWKEGDALRFGTDQAGGTERMRITSGGQVGIGTPAPNSSALLEIASTTQGFLPPRMTESQRMAIATSSAGLLVFQTDAASGYYYHNGMSWIGLTGVGGGALNSSACIDIDGNAYPTMTIGNQVWMAENLRVFRYRNGDTIYNFTWPDDWYYTVVGAYCWYDNDQLSNAKYGALYNWFAVNDSRGLCPAGWRVPNETDWVTLKSYLGGYLVSGGKMKSVSSLWSSPNADATNISGFSALPAGYRNYSCEFLYKGDKGFWWSSTEFSGTFSHSRQVEWDEAELLHYSYEKHLGLSVRCVRE